MKSSEPSGYQTGANDPCKPLDQRYRDPAGGRYTRKKQYPEQTMATPFDRSIQQNRFHEFRLSFPGGTAPGNVEITQVRHRTQFAANVFGLLSKKGPALDAYRQKLRSLWNGGTLPFYWGSYEPREGQTVHDAMASAVDMARADGLSLKGHPLVWHTVAADWLKKYDTPTVERMLMDRITRELTDFGGQVQAWDVVNEAVIMPVYDRDDNAITRVCKSKGVIDFCLSCFRHARDVAPDATLLINDFNLSPDYADLIRTLLDRGCPMDGIGIQTHMHQGHRGTEYFDTILERFGSFGLPLHFSEITLLSGEEVDPSIVDLNDAKRDDWPSTPEGEERQARDVENFYSQIWAHPLVASMTWWDMEDGQWLNAPSGLLRRDGSPKPAWHALDRLINKEWKYPGSTHKVAPGGSITIRAPEGDYRLRIDGRDVALVLDRGSPDRTIS